MDGSILSDDPYLQYQPAFAYTLPSQLLVTGVTLTLLGVLLIHLLFTTQYHYPLAPLNFILQFFSILVVLISVIVKIVIIMTRSADNADVWPYDLDYVAVIVPPLDWSPAQNAAWFFLQALNNAFANITHIQFLTLLYPSRTEARLIIFVLGPLAIASSGLVFTALSSDQTVLDLGDAIRNVFNSTLLLIFTISLALWGFLVNRRRAWRTDGGTAVFGMGSLALAVISTVGNFIAIKEDGIDWLQHLLWAAVLWQTWLGWWWWVGSGMGIGEVEDMVERAERKKRKQARRDHRSKVTGPQSRSRTRATSLVSHVSASAMAGFTSGVTGILRTGSETLTRSRPIRTDSARRSNLDIEEGLADSRGEHIQLDDLGGGRLHSPRPDSTSGPSGSGGSGSTVPAAADTSGGTGTGTGPNGVSTNSETSTTSRTPSLHAPRSIGSILAFPTTWIQVYLHRLRRAHEDAAKKQALERAELRQKVFSGTADGAVDIAGRVRQLDDEDVLVGPEGNRAKHKRDVKKLKGKERQRSMVLGTGQEDVGWGLGRFGIKEHQESALRLQKAGDVLRQGRLLSTISDLSDTPPSGGTDGDGNDNEPGPSSRPELGIGTSSRPNLNLKSMEGGEKEWEDVDASGESSSDRSRREKKERQRKKKKERDERRGDGTGTGGSGTGTGWSWWGPLKDWRLGDRTVYN